MNPHTKRLLWIFAGSILIMLAISPYDRISALAGWYYSTEFLAVFFNDNFYEHGKFGLPDIVTILLVSSLFVYGIGFTSTKIGLKLRPYRKEAGYIMNGGFTVAVSVIHALKWLFSRARPHDVYPYNQDQFTHWFMPGTYPLEVGFNRGSFPSGHVATISVLLTLFFLIPSNDRTRTFRRAYGVFVVLLSLLMGWYRMMNSTHWLTDNVASLFLSILILYFLYYFVHFPDPSVRRDYPWTNTVNDRISGWEFYLLWTTFGFLFSLAGFFVGIRLLMRDSILVGAFSAFAGIFLAVLFLEIILRIVAKKSLFLKKVNNHQL